MSRATTYIGIDPGLTGALVAIRPNGELAFYDMPTLRVGKKNTYDVQAIRMIVSMAGDCVVVVEKQQAMPAALRGRTQGTVSSFATGFGYGLILGIIAGLCVPVEIVHPRTWKAAMLPDQSKEKQASIARALQLFPFAAEQLKRKKDHGRADALLIAEYARRIGV